MSTPISMKRSVRIQVNGYLCAFDCPLRESGEYDGIYCLGEKLQEVENSTHRTESCKRDAVFESEDYR